VFLAQALLSGVTAWAGPCYGLDPCDHDCPDHCTRAECGPPDPCDRSCPSTYDPTIEHVNDRSWLYGYDSLNRLISADFGHLNDANDAVVPDATVAEAMQSTWSLDPLGNWVPVGTPNDPGYRYGFLRRYDTDADGTYGDSFAAINHTVGMDNQVTAVAENADTTQHVYDRRGNLVWDGTNVYRYDAFSRLVKVFDGTTVDEEEDFDENGRINTDSLPVKASFTYDAVGRLITYSNGTETEHYYYDGVRRIQTIVDKPDPQADETRAEYVYGPDYVDEFVLQTYRWVNPTTGIAELRAAYVLQDANYNVVALTQPGSVRMQYAWEPYGTIAAADHNGVDIDNRIGHQGLFYYSFDSAAATVAAATPTAHGLYYNRNRWYSPQVGRFTTADPNETSQLLLGVVAMNGDTLASVAEVFDARGHFGDGMNLYSVAQSNPMSGSDPLGLFSYGEVGTGMAIQSSLGALMGGAVDGWRGAAAGAFAGGVGGAFGAMAQSAFGFSAAGLWGTLVGRGMINGLGNAGEDYLENLLLGKGSSAAELAGSFIMGFVLQDFKIVGGNLIREIQGYAGDLASKYITGHLASKWVKMGFRDSGDLRNYLTRLMRGSGKALSGGRMGWWDPKTGVTVIIDGSGGTVFVSRFNPLVGAK
jgi:YD repeat-containing protein